MVLEGFAPLYCPNIGKGASFTSKFFCCNLNLVFLYANLSEMTAVAWRWDKVFAGRAFCCRMNWMMYGGKVKCKSWFARFWLFAEAVRQKWGRGAGISLTTALQLSAWLSSDTLTKVTNKNYIFLLESETAKTKVIKNRALSFRSPVPGSYHNPYWCMLSRNHFSNVHSGKTKGKFKV